MDRYIFRSGRILTPGGTDGFSLSSGFKSLEDDFHGKELKVMSEMKDLKADG